MKFYDQSEFEIRCEWGLHGVRTLAPISDVIIIVDILSFTTCVDIATENGAIIYPYRFADDSAIEYAKSKGAMLASSRIQSSSQFSLSPTSLLNITPGTRLVLPSPNGATLTLSTGKTTTLAGCFRNCQAVAEYANRLGRNIAVIPSGERWEDASLRSAIEDFIGAGAIISFLKGVKSPEAQAAQTVFESIKTDLAQVIFNCSSGKELIEGSFQSDVEHAIQFNCSKSVPLFRNEAYTNQTDRI